MSPKEILIIGAGEFGLSTALALLHRPNFKDSHITILDSSEKLPNPYGSSVDTSRIIRADYANRAYAELAIESQKLWRDKSDSGWGGQGRYHENGFVLTVDDKEKSYVYNAMNTVKSLAKELNHHHQDHLNGNEISGGIDGTKIQELPDEESILKVTGYEGISGKFGYVNWNSGWADAKKCMDFIFKKIQSEGKERIKIKSNHQVKSLIIDQNNNQCKGVLLTDGRSILSNLTILATGAWSSTLFKPLIKKCLATGQVLTYIKITDEEQRRLQNLPTVMNMSKGTFIIPPRNNELKIARHGFGYRNLLLHQFNKDDNDQEGENEKNEILLSIPTSKSEEKIPEEGKLSCQEYLSQILPSMKGRKFSRTRLCWYCDTPKGDFIISYVPKKNKTLFIATGGSGHGFKFFPLIGEKIVDSIEGKLDSKLDSLWRWNDDDDDNNDNNTKEEEEGFLGTDDGSRAGPKGMILSEELKRLES